MNNEDMNMPSVLIVDDVPKNLQVLGNILSKKGYKIAAAVNGQQALGIINSAPPDIILLDVMMPEPDGFEVCKKLKASEKTKEIPVIFLTAKTETEDIVKGFELGAVDYVTKPFNKTELLVRVHNHLDLKNARDTQAELTASLREARKKVAESIRYAKKLQHTILPNPENMKISLPESFYIWMPKDVVGGDIIMTDSSEESIIVAVMDCTGHSVPGAFMTVIAFQAMTRIIRDEGCRDPAEILKQLNLIIKASLQQDTHSDDGLDAAVCAVSLKKKSVIFAGAGLPMFYICNGELRRVRGDRQSIGHKTSDPEYDFTGHEIPVENKTSFYLSTNGFWDQPGGDNGLALGKDMFKSLLIEYSREPFYEQKDLLVSAFNSYKGDYERHDDIAMVGFSLG